MDDVNAMDDARELADLRSRLDALESTLSGAPLVTLHVVATPAGPLRVALTERLRQRSKKARAWKCRAMLQTLKNARYGFLPDRPRARGGLDGIFLVDRRFRPVNAMMRKLFDGFLDKPGSPASAIADALGVPLATLLPVRLVSHHMRLLGLLTPDLDGDGRVLVLVDLDASE